MQIKLTRVAQNKMLLKGIMMHEVENIIRNGIKLKHKAGILSKYGELTVLYSKINGVYLIKTVVEHGHMPDM